MPYVNLDLENFRDDIREYYCNKARCLNQAAFCRSLEDRLQQYIDDLDRSIYIFKDNKKTVEDVLSDLKNIVR